jgi:hypothetical protein
MLCGNEGTNKKTEKGRKEEMGKKKKEEIPDIANDIK